MAAPLLCQSCTELVREGKAECVWQFSPGCYYSIVACWHTPRAIWCYCLPHAAQQQYEFELVRKDHSP